MMRIAHNRTTRETGDILNERVGFAKHDLDRSFHLK